MYYLWGGDKNIAHCLYQAHSALYVVRTTSVTIGQCTGNVKFNTENKEWKVKL
jgi:hypothetical protein